MAQFDGEIRIQEGVYAAKGTDSLGTSKGGTVVLPQGTLKFISTTANQLAFKDTVTVYGTSSLVFLSTFSLINSDTKNLILLSV